MEVRRRNPETVRADRSNSPPVEQQNVASAKNPLMERGLKLYEEAEQTGFQDENRLKKSLEYFVQAAENGADDAVEKISSFLDSMTALLPPSVVLPESLVKAMQWLTEATESEKQVRAVAKSMFSKMAGSKMAGRSGARPRIASDDGETSVSKTLQTIPKAKIDEFVQALLASESESVHPPGLERSGKELKSSVKRLLHSALLLSETNEVTEESFCKAAIMYARGELLSPLESTALTSQQLEDFEKANLLKKASEYPSQTLQYLKRSALRMVERRGIKWLWASFPTKQFYLLLLAYILPMLTVNFIISTICTAVFVLSFITMSTATLQIVVDSEKIFSFLEYSSVFQYFSHSLQKINTKTPEKWLIQRSIGPYIAFLLSFLLAMVTLGLSHQQLIFYEVLCVVAAVLATAVFFQFQCYKSPLVLLSVSTRLMSWLYVFLLLASAWIPIPEFLFFGAKQIITIPLFLGTSLGINIMTLVQFPLQLTVMVYLLFHDTWRNFYAGLGPYILFMCWWVLCRNFLSQSSLSYLFLVIFGVLIFASLVPILPLLLMGSPIFFLFYYGLTQPFFISLSLVIITGLIALFVAKKFRQLKEAKWLNIPFDYIIFVPILISIPLVLFGASLFADMYRPSSLPTVTVQEYTKYCGPQNWEGNNMVQTQLNCLHLQGRLFHANGTVQSVRISHITNDKETSLKSLPSSLATTLTCFFGQTKPMCGDQEENNETCIYSGCHFLYSNKYTFEIKLEMPVGEGRFGPIPVSLFASNKFAPAVTEMRERMDIGFNATFVEGMGSDKLSLHLTSLVVNDKLLEEREGIEDEEEEKQHMLSKLALSLRNTMSLLLEIVFGYTPPNFHKLKA